MKRGLRIPMGQIAAALLMLSAFAATNVLAQTTGVPDMSGIWESSVIRHRDDLCGEPSCRVFVPAAPASAAPRPAVPSPPPVEEPQILPWAEEKYKSARVGLTDAAAAGQETADPWFTGCLPMGPTRLLLNPFNTVELRQFQDLVLLFFSGSGGEGDHTVRRIYLDGRGHPANWKHTPMGHSTGRYEGDTLVVDTVGIREGAWLDPQGHPSSDALHLTERFRRLSRETLEYQVVIEDPKAYAKPWSRRIVRELAQPGPRIWDESECEELLEMGTHYGAEAR